MPFDFPIFTFLSSVHFLFLLFLFVMYVCSATFNSVGYHKKRLYRGYRLWVQVLGSFGTILAYASSVSSYCEWFFLLFSCSLLSLVVLTKISFSSIIILLLVPWGTPYSVWLLCHCLRHIVAQVICLKLPYHSSVYLSSTYKAPLKNATPRTHIKESLDLAYSISSLVDDFLAQLTILPLLHLISCLNIQVTTPHLQKVNISFRRDFRSKFTMAKFFNNNSSNCNQLQQFINNKTSQSSVLASCYSVNESTSAVKGFHYCTTTGAGMDFSF